MREQEYRRAEEANVNLTRWSDSGGKAELESVIHEPMSFAHERDLRTLSMFLFQANGNIQLRVLELTHDGIVVANTYPYSNDANLVVYLIAADGHLRWAKPSPVTHQSTWEEWKREFDEVIIRPFVGIASEGEEVKAMGQARTSLFPCKHCRLTIKTAIASLTTGSLTTPDIKREVQQEKCAGSGQGTMTSGKGQSSPARHHNTLDNKGQVNPGRVENASQPPILRTEKEEAEYVPTMEALGTNWRRSLTVLPQTRKYLEAARQPFADNLVETVAELGSRLVATAGGFVEAGTQIQEFRMRDLGPNLGFIEEYGYLYPSIHDPACEVFATGGNPLLQTVLPAISGEDEKPHGEKLTPLILQTLWEDVQDGSMFLRRRDVIPPTEFVAASSTGTVPKKNKDRAISEKVRIISDLRRVNLPLKKTEVCFSCHDP